MLGFGPVSDVTVSSVEGEWRWHVYAYSQLIFSETLTKIYAATTPFITRASDTPANQPFDGTLGGSIRIDKSIAAGDSGYGGFSQSISEISLINSSGIYDDLASGISLNGQEVICSVGEITGRDTVEPYAAFAQFALLRAERMVISRQKVTVELRDPSLVLSEQLVQRSVYGGGGGADGDPEITGKRRPYGDGTVFNATPIQVIGAEGVWQCNDGAVSSITGVKDGGVYLTSAGNFASLALLRAATIDSGEYGTCNAEGYFRLGGASFKQVTVDFTGLRSTTADIIRVIALAAGLSAAQIDSSSFDALNIRQPAPVSYYLDADSSQTAAEMFTSLMRGIGGWHGMNVLGQLQVQVFDAPDEIATAMYASDGGDLADIDRVPLLTGLDPPPRRRRVAYARNYTTMTDLFGEVSFDDPALAEYLKTPFKLAATSDMEAVAIVTNWPQAPDPDPTEAYFVHEIDAQAEAERLLELYSSGLLPYRAVLKNALFLHQIGEVIWVQDNRLGLDDGKYLRLVEIIDDTGSGTEAIGLG